MPNFKCPSCGYPLTQDYGRREVYFCENGRWSFTPHTTKHRGKYQFTAKELKGLSMYESENQRDWRVYRSFLAGAAVTGPVAFTNVLAGIWLESEKMGWTALVFGVMFIVSLGMAGMMFETLGPKPVKLSRKQRQQVENERRRIELDKTIQRLEREAGLS